MTMITMEVQEDMDVAPTYLLKTGTTIVSAPSYVHNTTSEDTPSSSSSHLHEKMGYLRLYGCYYESSSVRCRLRRQYNRHHHHDDHPLEDNVVSLKSSPNNRFVMMVYSTCVLLFVSVMLMSHPLPISSQSLCPSKCNCIWRNGKQTTNCESQGLISIPSGIQASTQVLSLNSNNFQILPAKVFQERGLINLQKVFLSKCKLGVIARDAFLQLTNLIELDLSANLLTSVPPDSFEATPNLRRLVMSNNPISSVKSGTFALTPNLNYLELADCQIDSIEAGAFKGLTNLQYLKLEGNRLTTLSFLVLQDLPPLYSLDLHKNPWNCNCLLRPAREWMLRHNVPQSIPPTCLGPEKLSGMMWNSLELDEFACAPAILSRDTEITGMIGTNVSFTCITRAMPEAKVSWLIEDVIYRNLSSGPGLSLGSSSSSLSASSQASFSASSASSSSPSSSSSGSSSSSNPSLMVPTKGERFAFTEDRSSGPSLVSSTLTIFNLEGGDSGKSFVCYAENSAGIASKSFTVSVLSLSGSVVGGWSKTEIAGSIILAVVLVVIFFVGAVCFLRSKKFKDSGSSAGSTNKSNHHPIHPTDSGSSASSGSTNSHKSTASTNGSFPTIDVLKNVPVNSTPSPLTSKDIVGANGQIIGYNNLSHHHSHHHLLAPHFNHLHHVHPYSTHDPTDVMLNESGGMSTGMPQMHHHPSYVSSGHVNAYPAEFIDSSGYPLLQHHHQQPQQQEPFYGDQSPSQQMFSSAEEVRHLHHQQPMQQQGLYGGQHHHHLHHHNHQPSISHAVVTSTANTGSNMNVSEINNEQQQHQLQHQSSTTQLSTLDPEEIPLSGTCVICQQFFSDLRFHYMDFHEIRECIV